MRLSEDAVFDSLLQIYKELGNRGKPLSHEHTTLAGISVEFDTCYTHDQEWSGKSVFLALATGTKCIPAASRNLEGFALHDSHAEILVRRILTRWLLEEVELVYNGRSSLVIGLNRLDNGVNLLKGVSFRLVISSPPCGDCAIFSDQSGFFGNKRFRTGAKVVRKPSEIPEARMVESYDGAQALGIVRRKPGKGLATSSVSCSDKILKWNVLGFQGCLLRSLLDRPIYFNNITVAYAMRDGTGKSNELASDALKRALWQRADAHIRRDRRAETCLPPTKLHALVVSPETLDAHGLIQSESRSSSSGASVSWWAKPSTDWKSSQTEICSRIPKGDKNFCEIIVGKTGYKMGSPKLFPKDVKQIPNAYCSRFSRAAMKHQFANVMLVKGQHINSELSYEQFKRLVCPEYVDAWQKLRKPPSLFSNWILKNTS